MAPGVADWRDCRSSDWLTHERRRRKPRVLHPEDCLHGAETQSVRFANGGRSKRRVRCKRDLPRMAE